MENNQLYQIIQGRKVAYTKVFGGEVGAVKEVFDDLNRFCRASESTFHVDARVHALLEGRREVVLRIADYLSLSVDELVDKYGGKNGK